MSDDNIIPFPGTEKDESFHYLVSDCNESGFFQALIVTVVSKADNTVASYGEFANIEMVGDFMKKLWKAVKREFDLWKKRRAYFKQLEKEFEKKQTG